MEGDKIGVNPDFLDPRQIQDATGLETSEIGDGTLEEIIIIF